MGLLADLAARPCERLTSRLGCLGPHEDPRDRCNPCQARVEIGADLQAPRRCSNCDAILARVDITKDGASGIDEGGGPTCPPPPHVPILFSDEYALVRGRR